LKVLNLCNVILIMQIFQDILKSAVDFIPSVAAFITFVIIYYALHVYLNRRLNERPSGRFRYQIISIIVVFFAVLIIILLLPLSDSLRGQILSFVGILLSAALALSATTILGNILAGLMLRAIRNFRPGDFIRVGENFGRVSERGLFHVTIQTEDRDLMTLPNLYLINNPVKVIMASGTFVSAEVSLGYDAPKSKVMDLLVRACEDAGLEDPFVHIINLNDFSVSYRVAGKLTEIKQILSARSLLREKMLDRLHENGIEICSPTFMNTRQFSPEHQVIPEREPATPDERKEELSDMPEKLLFDIADEAESLEKLQEYHAELGKEIENFENDIKKTESDAAKEELKKRIAHYKNRQERIVELIKKRKEEKSE